MALMRATALEQWSFVTWSPDRVDDGCSSRPTGRTIGNRKSEIGNKKGPDRSETHAIAITWRVI